MATTYDSDITGSNTVLAPNTPWGAVVCESLRASQTINTTTLIATDFQRLWPVPNGAELLLVFLNVQDADAHATPTLDMDLTLRDDNGDTVLFNAGTAFQAAYDDYIILDSQKVLADADKPAYIGFEVVTAAATGVAAATVSGLLFYR